MNDAEKNKQKAEEISTVMTKVGIGKGFNEKQTVVTTSASAPKMSVGVADFSGKVLKVEKSTFFNGAQVFIKAGTKFEDIPKQFKIGGSHALVFNESDFSDKGE